MLHKKKLVTLATCFLATCTYIHSMRGASSQSFPANATQKWHIAGKFFIDEEITFTPDTTPTLNLSWSADNNAVYFNYNTATGDATWHQKNPEIVYSYNANTTMWTKSDSDEEWSYNPISKTWIQASPITEDYWIHNQQTGYWTGNHGEEIIEWSWNASHASWTDITTMTEWRYDFIQNNWILQSGSSPLPSITPPLPLIQQLYTFMTLKSAYTKGINTPSSNADWALKPIDQTHYSGTNSTNDFLLSCETKTQSYNLNCTHISQSTKKTESITYSADIPHNHYWGSFSWHQTLSPLFSEQWTYSAETSRWKDAQSGEEWEYDEAKTTLKNIPTNETWTGSSYFKSLSYTWQHTGSNALWTFSPDTGRWQHTDNEHITWEYQFQFLSQTWKQITTHSGNTKNPFPPLPIVQFVYIASMISAYYAESFSDSSWSVTTHDNNQVSFTNTSRTGIITYNHQTSNASCSLGPTISAHLNSETENSYWINAINQTTRYISSSFNNSFYDDSPPINALSGESTFNTSLKWSSGDSKSYLLSHDYLISWHRVAENVWTNPHHGVQWHYEPEKATWKEDGHNATWRYNQYLQTWQQLTPENTFSLPDSYFPPQPLIQLPFFSQLKKLILQVPETLGEIAPHPYHQNIFANTPLYPTKPIEKHTETEKFLYDPSAAFDIPTFTGTFSYTNSATGTSWVASPDPQYLFNFTDQFIPTHIPSSWCWKDANNKWIFNGTTGEFYAMQQVEIWKNTSFGVWENTKTNDIWTRHDEEWQHAPDTLTDTWIHGPDKNSWFNKNPQWSPHGNWSLDEKNMIWTQKTTCSPQQWAYNALRETVSCINSDATQNSWRQLNTETWIEEFSGHTWIYTESSWRNVTNGYIWTYDHTHNQWISAQSEKTLYIPPFFPPPVVLQCTAIYDFQDDISRNVLPTSMPEGEYCWQNNDITVKIHSDSSIDVLLPALSARAGRGERYGYSPSSFFETTLGERWLLQTNTQNWQDIFSGTYQAPQFINISNNKPNTLNNTEDACAVYSSNIAFGNHYIPDAWYRYLPHGPGSAWFYQTESQSFIGNLSNAPYSFDLATLSWKNHQTLHQWKYVNNGTRWIWRNLTTNEDWDLITTRGNGPLLSTVYFYNKNYGTFAPDQYKGYTYTDLNNTVSSISTNTFPSIYQISPSNLAGFACALTTIGYNDTTSSSPLSSTPGIFNRIKETKTALESLQEPFIKAVETYEGQTLYKKLIPILTNILSAGYKNNWLMAEYDRLINSYMMMTCNIVCYDSSFYSWAQPQMNFETTGKGGFTFTVWGSASDSLSQGILIGFAPTIPNDLTATYTFHLSGKSTYTEEAEFPYTTTYTVKMLAPDLETIIESQSLTVSSKTIENNDLHTDTHTYTCLYENGHIQFGITAPSITDLQSGNLSTSKIIFDHTIADGTTPNTIRFYSFANAPGYDGFSGSSFQFVHIDKQYSYDLYKTNAIAIDLIAQTEDYKRLEQFDVTFTSLKNNFISLADQNSFEAKASLITSLQKTITDSSIIQKLVTLKHNIASQNSLPLYNYYHHTSSYILAVTTAYQEYITLLNTLETELTQLLKNQSKMLSTEEAQHLIDNVEEKIAALIAAAQEDALGLALSHATTLDEKRTIGLHKTNEALNKDYAIFQDLTIALQQAKPSILSSFAARYDLLTTVIPPRDKQYETKRGLEILNVLGTLSKRIASGITTPFSALTTLFMLFSTTPFDEIKSHITTYLTTHNSLDYLALVTKEHPLSDEETCFTTLTTLVNDIALFITAQGNTLATPFAGNALDPNPLTNLSYIATTITQEHAATLATQQKEIFSGTTNYLNNSSFSTNTMSEKTINTIREILSESAEKAASYSRIYIKDALIALGNGNLTAQSGNALSLLGGTEITPDGNALITLNSDITITGSNFLTASTNFGNDLPLFRCIPATATAQRGMHEIIFYSAIERTITVASGTDLNLTSFAQGLVANGQRITFAGKVKLIFEPNTRFRLPYTSQAENNRRLTISFKDDAELIFQGIENYDLPPFTDALNGPDLIRTKILGCGKLQFSGNAHATILRSALVGIEADYTSNVTAIEIELNDNSTWSVGTPTTSGGGLQIGNIIDGGSNNLNPSAYPNNNENPNFGNILTPFSPRKTQIDFTLTLNGSHARFHIDRNGFVGFGIGTINKENVINGTTTTPPWLVHQLYNLSNVTLNLLNGSFSHQSIADGNDPNASLLAFGPQIPRALYKLTLAKNNNTILTGGGNVLFFDAADTGPQPLSITKTISPLTGDISDNGKFSILAPPPLIMLRQTPNPNNRSFKQYGNATIYPTETLYQFNGAAFDLFRAITFQEPTANGRYVIASKKHTTNSVTYIGSDNTIVTQSITPRNVRDRSNQSLTAQNLSSECFLQAANRAALPTTFIRKRI